MSSTDLPPTGMCGARWRYTPLLACKQPGSVHQNESQPTGSRTKVKP